MSSERTEPQKAPRPFDEPQPSGEARLDGLARLLAVVDRLRAPDGCEWDLKQTTVSMAPSLVEEAHELLEALEARDDGESIEEAGDLLMVVVLICRIAQDEGRFDLAAAAEAVSDKLIRRHPHVFGSASVDGAEEVAVRWEQIKQAERQEKGVDSSAVAGVPVALPALQRAQRLGKKAMAAGFRWDDAVGALAKLREEVEELAEACEQAGLVGAGGLAPAGGAAARPAPSAEQRGRMQAELGDVCVAAAQLANYLGLDPEASTREAVRRFERRFRRMEQELRDGPLGGTSGADLETWMAAWRRAKAVE